MLVINGTLKFRFASTPVKVIGHVVSKEGIRPDENKINGFLNLLRLLRKDELRSCFVTSAVTFATFSDILQQ